MRSYRVNSPLKYRVVGWLGLLLCASGYFMLRAWSPGVAIPILTVFGLLSLCAIVEGFSVVEVSSEMVVQKKLYGRYGIRWDEVDTIRYCVAGELMMFETMLLGGGGKRLSIPGPRDWGGGQGADARHWFYSEVRRRGLDIKEDNKAVFKFSRNVRLS